MPISISAKQRIEQTPRIAKLEMAWCKSKAGELRPADEERYHNTIIQKKPFAADYMEIHTHPKADHKTEDSKFRALPSARDILYFLDELCERPNISTCVIVSVNSNGEVAGYTFLRAKDEFIERAKQMKMKHESYETQIEKEENIYGRAKSLIDGVMWYGRSKTKVYKSLELFSRVGLQIRFVPMPGYKFEKDRFVEVA